MRIVVSNPDTLGDLVLRQPMYRALLDAGHELLLIVRRSVEPLVPYVAPGVRVVVLPGEVYADDVDRRWEEFADTFAAARDFAPDALLVAPYRWTLFEERLAEELPPGVKRIGMSGHLYAGDPHAGPSPVSRMRFDVTADVREDAPEVDKNAALAAAVLGGTFPARIDPKLEATEEALVSARQTLARLGLEPGRYFVACVGGTAHVAIKTWQPENWGQLLAEWARQTGRRFLFVGLPQEAPATRQVLEAMASAGGDGIVDRHAEVWMEPGGTLDELLALTQLSAGYVGHDTGPMHVAAAMGKRTLAVFGGGTWPRFLPAVDPSVALTVGVSCVGCGWICSFHESHCIKRVPVEDVLRGAMDLESGKITGREGRVIEPSKELQAQMIRESAELVRQQVRERAGLGRQLQETRRLHGADAAEAREAEAARLRDEVRAVREEAARAWDDARQRAAETAALREQLESEAAEARKLSATLEAQTVEVGRLRDEIRGMVRDMERSNGNGRRLAGDVITRHAGAETSEGPPGGAGPPAQREAARDDELALLRAAIERMENRLRAMEPQPFQARQRLRQLLVELFIGGKTYGWRTER
ncbi:MAG TPA: glycosyltransferase family 9 protein, partial [Tepidisphaeraceae bacterium]|nr:glycosyltransferase family 9 protein [Tepidisphaeraceae bacterium]